MEGESWDKIKHLHPRLPNHISIQPRPYKHETWYVLHDSLSNQFHRLNRPAFLVIGLMDGKKTLEDIVGISNSRLSIEEHLNPQAAVELIQYLHSADLLISEALPNSKQTKATADRKQSQKRKRLLANPFIWRVPLFNPNQILSKMVPLGKFISTPLFGFVWMLVVGYGILMAFEHWPQLMSQDFGALFSPKNLLLLWLTYPLLKVFHELGHALFTKTWGGQVLECGVVFIMATPLPYVDATAATGFSSKHQRLMVSAAGMAVELFIASIALFIWLIISDPFIKTLLFNIILIGSVSTLLFNGNPLMRFDGYYILTDLLDAPNLAQRGLAQLKYLSKKFVLRIPEVKAVTKGKLNHFGLSLYAIAGVVYRFVVLVSLTVIAGAIWPPMAIAVGGWMIATQLILPLLKFIQYIARGSELEGKRFKTGATLVITTVFLTFAIGWQPIPYTTHTHGIVWLPETAILRAEGGGQVISVNVADGTNVVPGTALMHLQNPELEAELARKEIQLREAQTEYHAAWGTDRNAVQRVAKDIEALRQEIAHLEKQVRALTITSHTHGTFRLVKPYNLKGSFIEQGDMVAIIQNETPIEIRTVLNQGKLGLVSTHTEAVEVKLSGSGQTLEATITQEVPQGTFKLPSAALGTGGGGEIVVKTEDTTLTQTAEEVFVFSLAIQSPLNINVYGQRAYVRFIHERTPAFAQFMRFSRQWLQRILHPSVNAA